MKETEAIIERVRRANDHYQHLELAVDESLPRIKPGQSLMIRLTENWHPYLREQWWPISISGEKLIVERPVGQHYAPGQVISVLGLVGQPFRFRRTLRNVMLLAYDTPPTPLLLTIPWLLGNRISVTLVLIGSAMDYDTRHLPPEVEVIHGDEDINWPNQVMTVGWADQVFAVVSPDDEIGRFRRIYERFEERRSTVPQQYLFGVFQPSLPCGAGACQACTLRVRTKGMQLVCTDGPAFDLVQVTSVG